MTIDFVYALRVAHDRVPLFLRLGWTVSHILSDRTVVAYRGTSAKKPPLPYERPPPTSIPSGGAPQ